MTYPAKIAAALHEIMEACSYVQKTKRGPQMEIADVR